MGIALVRHWLVLELAITISIKQKKWLWEALLLFISAPSVFLQGNMANYHVQQQHRYMYSKQPFAHTDNLTYQPSPRRLHWSLPMDSVSEADTVIVRPWWEELASLTTIVPQNPGHRRWGRSKSMNMGSGWTSSREPLCGWCPRDQDPVWLLNRYWDRDLKGPHHHLPW